MSRPPRRARSTWHGTAQPLAGKSLHTCGPGPGTAGSLLTGRRTAPPSYPESNGTGRGTRPQDFRQAAAPAAGTGETDTNKLLSGARALRSGGHRVQREPHASPVNGAAPGSTTGDTPAMLEPKEPGTSGTHDDTP
ncbi:hypothetical protein GA0115246_108431, partial [Streptomyces sp. SolWspMP-sol7th]